jgi:hypothetical protein
MDKFLNNSKYLLIRLVGNQYCQKKPSSKDTKLRFKYEKDNEYDTNAIKVLTIRENEEIPLGYIERHKNIYLKSLIKKKNVKYKMIIQKLEYDEIHYYIVFKFKNIVNV